MYAPTPTTLEPTLEGQISDVFLPNDGQFESKQVDNEGFFQAIADGLPSILSDTEIHKKARLELQTLFADMKKRKFIRGVTEWTASEQKSFFAKVQSEVENVGTFASTQIREKIQSLIEYELWREINDDGQKYALQDGDGNMMISDMCGYRQFLDTSFVTNKETTVIPLDLRLTVSARETVADAQNKLDRYNGKYNALVLVDSANRPIGVVRQSTLREHENNRHVTLEHVAYIREDVFGYYHTTSKEAKERMESNGINILPIVDSNTGILIGILTGATVAKKELHHYYTTSLTKFSLDCLGSHV